MAALERERKAILRDRLEQIVDRGDLERPDRILVVRGHEDHRWHPLCSNGLDDRKAVGSRHLHVEEHQVRLLLANEGDRLSSVSRFRDGFDLRLTAEQPLQPLARERLVVHDENPQSHRPSSGATVRIGNVIVTRTPRPAACSTTRRALSPYSRARRVLVFVSPIPE